MRPPRFRFPTLAFQSPRRRTAVALAGASVALLASASSADAACATTPSSTIFKSLGDLANYSLAPGGNFETGTSGWSLTNASVVSGSETAGVGGAKDSKSLAISANGTAVSAPFCVGIEHPSFRFVARKTSGTWAELMVSVRYTDSSGHVNTTTVGALDGGSYATWTATPSEMLATALPLWQAGQSVTAQIVFAPLSSGGSWQIDDLYIDPYRRS